jgi:hypothetical protein
VICANKLATKGAFCRPKLETGKKYVPIQNGATLNVKNFRKLHTHEA